jgi:hypothetical protein
MPGRTGSGTTSAIPGPTGPELRERPDRAERLVFRRHSARARRIKAGQLQRSSPPPAPARCTRPARTMLPGKKPGQRPMSLWQAKPPVPGQ